MKSLLKIFSVLAVLAIAVSMAPVTALADDPLTVSIPVSVSIEGTPPVTPETYTIRMTADGDYPMPGGATGGSFDLKITGPGTGTFPAITFDHVGIFTYTIRQSAGSDTTAQYDSTVYTLKVTVYWKDGVLELSCALRKQGEETKLDSCPFKVIYPELVDVTVSKVWKDSDNARKKRPESLTVSLMNGSTTVQKVTLNEGNKWTATVTRLPKYDSAKKEIKYTWSEPEIPGYKLAGTTTSGTTTTLTNEITGGGGTPPKHPVKPTPLGLGDLCRNVGDCFE